MTSGGLAVSSETVGERLRWARQRRFVGRTGEITLFRAMVQASPPSFVVLFVHGPGGTGKTSLLRAFSDIASDAGVVPVYLDARVIEPSPSGFLAGLATVLGLPEGVSPQETLGSGRFVLLVDTYEAAAALDDWLRERLLPQLSGDVSVVIAGRNPPAPVWVADPGWHELVRVVSLPNLPPEDARAYLAVEGIAESLQDRVLKVTHGHPLALSLFVDVVAQLVGPIDADRVLDFAEVPDVVRLLLERFLEDVPSARHRQALEVCAHSRFTTEGLLRHALGGDDAGQLFLWLRRLSFVEEGSLGLFPHDLARDVFDADLRWRDPGGYADLHRRIRAYIVRRAQRSGSAEQQRAGTDILFLHRTNPVVRPYVDWASLGQGYVDVLGVGDRQPIVAMTERHEGSESAALVAYWMDRQPDAFKVFRAADEEPIGFVALLALDRATHEDLAIDPGARAMWTYVLRHGCPAVGEHVMAFRFFLDREAYQGISPSFNLWGACCIGHIITSRRLAWSLGAVADPDSIAPMFANIDYHRAAEADFDVAGRCYGVFAHDFRRVPAQDWLELIGQREIGEGLGSLVSSVPAPILALSQPEFVDAVRRALRDLHRPDRLASNPLLRSRIARYHAGEDPQVGVLGQLIREATDTLRADPRDEKLYRALDRTYLRPTPTQERAAEMLGLPFSTYRRHLTRAVERVASSLWKRELHGLGNTAYQQ